MKKKIMNNIRADVMRCAWVLAQEAAEKHGGKASEYVNQCVRKAWAKVKRSVNRVADERFTSAFIANVARCYWAANKTVLDWGHIHDFLIDDMQLPAKRYHCYALQGIALNKVMKYIAFVTLTGALALRPAQDVRTLMIREQVGTDEHRDNMNTACDDIATVQGFEGYSWTNDYLTGYEKSIQNLYEAYDSAKATKTAYDMIANLYSAHMITRQEKNHFEDTADWYAHCKREKEQRV